MLKRLLPILQWLPYYKKSYIAGDVFAGLTVGVMLIPQGMAYAMIAGLPPIYGLYAGLIPQICYAIFGTSRKLAVGPVALDSLIVAAGLGALSISGIDNYIGMALFLTFFVGLLQLVFGLLRLGFLANFLSKPVISGFTSAAAIVIAFGQLHHLLGVELKASGKIGEIVNQIITNLDAINGYALLIGLVAITIISILQKINRKIPAPLLVVIFSIVFMYFTKIDAQGVAIVGEIPKGLPFFQTPNFSLSRIWDLFPIAITLALLGFVQAISISRALEENGGLTRLSPNRELVALGLANIFGSFFQSYTTTGSFSRSAVQEKSGAKTAIVLVVSALVVMLVLLFLTSVFYYLPNTVLAAIIMVSVYGLIDFKYPLELFRTKKDEFILLLATFLITLIVGVVQGIVFGVLFSLVLLVYRTSIPHIAVVGRIKGTNYFRNIDRFNDDVEEDKRILILRLDDQLYFANKDYFKKRLLGNVRRRQQNLEFVILKAEAINYIDSTALQMLEEVIDELKEQNIQFLISGAIGPIRDTLFNSGFINKIGSEHIFVRTLEAYEYCNGISKKSEIQNRISLQAHKSKSVT